VTASWKNLNLFRYGLSSTGVIVDLIYKLIFRSGLVVAMALTLRLIGGLFTPEHPSSPASVHISGVLAAPLTDPIMQNGLQVLAMLKRSSVGARDGAKLTFNTPDGEVQLDANDVEVLNEFYIRSKKID
jgi:hypothetical protein